MSKKIAVIDIGSNSVRLMLSQNGLTLYKINKITRLADGLCGKSVLNAEAIERTARAVSTFNAQALTDGACEIYAFATAAVRQSSNSKVFIDRVKSFCGLVVEIIDGKTEAELGYKGALSGKDGGIIDIGGGSTEITVVKNGVCIYSKSLDIGSVRTFNACGNDREKAEKFIDEKIKDYGEIPRSEFYGIGGTATTLSAISLALDPYDPTKTDGYQLTLNEVERLTKLLYALPLEERKKIKGLQPERAEVIPCGCAILLKIMQMAKIEKITVSEKDNLEGYLIKKGELNEKKN